MCDELCVGRPGPVDGVPGAGPGRPVPDPLVDHPHRHPGRHPAAHPAGLPAVEGNLRHSNHRRVTMDTHTASLCCDRSDIMDDYDECPNLCGRYVVELFRLD